MGKKLSLGQHPLSYLGVRATKPPQSVLKDRAPLSTDIAGYYIGDEWIVEGISQIFKLTNKDGGSATWTEIVTSGGGDDVESLIGDDGNHATPDAAGDITVAGGSNITTVGSIPNTLQVNLDNNVSISGTMSAQTFDTNIATAAVTLTGTTLAVDGTDTNIDLNITAKGSGKVIIDDLQLSTPLDAQYGGTGSASLTDHGLLVGSASGAITALSVAVDGEIPIGSAGSDPVLSTISGVSGISISNGPGSITIGNQLTINEQTGVSYTLQLSDNGKLITLDNPASITLTIPPNSSVAFPVGTQILITQKGAGEVTVSAGAGVTINSSYSEKVTYEQFSMAAIIQVETDVWYLGGDLS